MLNISQIVRESPISNPIEKLVSLRYPDIYIAENIADYLVNASKIEFQWYKRFPSFDNFDDRAYIIFQNVGLRRRTEKGYEDWFDLHDSSGEEVAYWNIDHKIFPVLVSFDEVSEKQGLKNDDWVSEVVVDYLINSNLAAIVDVQKYNYPKRKLKKDSLAERINKYLPSFQPELQLDF